jgi:hypothetical protein
MPPLNAPEYLLLVLGLLIGLAAAPAAAPAEDAWQDVRIAGAGFAVSMPPGELKTIDRPPTDDTEEGTHLAYVSAGETLYFAACIQFKPGSVGPLNEFFLLEGTHLTAEEPGDKLRSERHFEVDGHKAREAIVDTGGGDTNTLRAYVVGDRLLATMVLGPKGSDASAATKRFHESFHLLPH